MAYLRDFALDIRIVGIEPVEALRHIAYSKGLEPADIVDGDATALQFENDSFDLVTAFGVLHHLRQPELAVKEMLRVARCGIFISDSNNFGQGSLLARGIKQLLNAFKLWPIANLIKTGGKGYLFTQDDGVAYSYSVFNSYRAVRRSCRHVHIFNTADAGENLYRSASHVALLGIKDE